MIENQTEKLLLIKEEGLNDQHLARWITHEIRCYESEGWLNIFDLRKIQIKMKMMKINCSNKWLNDIKLKRSAVLFVCFRQLSSSKLFEFQDLNVWSFFERARNSNMAPRWEKDKHSSRDCWMLCKCAYGWFDI